MRSMWAKCMRILATGFGLGWIPLAPGTWGAAGGLASLILLNLWKPLWFPGSLDLYWPFLSLCVLLFLVGTAASHETEQSLGEDASQIVIDEWLGIWITMAFLPVTWQTCLIGFVLFRFFDIVKPFFARKAESIGWGVGVMLDDVLAGLYANVLLQLAIRTGWL
jgi:phosphatidylglycerophosphatase A